jgi:hypothetical protein
MVLALVLAASACGAEADMPGMDPGTGGSSGSPPDALPAIDTLGSGGSVAAGTGGSSGTGGAVAQGTGGAAAGTGGAQATGGVSGTGGAVAAGTGGAAGSGETPPPLPVCPGQLTASPCGYVGAPIAGGYEHVPRWKDGREISTCTADGKPQSGCLVSRPADPNGGGTARTYNLCVTNCNQGCYKKVGAVCASDADCCSPLHCKPGTVGTNKTCQ